MPRKYIKKKKKTYTSEDFIKAIEEIKSGKINMYTASKTYNIPMTTLFDNLKMNSSKKVGRPQAIPLEEEKQLADALKTLEKWGFGLSRKEVLDLVGDYVNLNKIETPFKNNVPGPDWFINFRKRHRLSIKKAQPVENARRTMTDPFVVYEYFQLLQTTLNELNLSESPHSIWNLDETSMSLDPTKTKVVGEINKPCSRNTFGTGKENITVLAAVSATGKKVPPLIVYKGKYIWDQWIDMTQDDDFELSYAASAKGWMETEVFYNFMEKILIPSLGEERPVLMIYDGHSTHVDIKVVNLAVSKGITIIKLPPHTSHLLQPLDLAVFKSFKSKWDAKLVDWQRRNIGRKIAKNIFARTLAETWNETNEEVIKNGFRKAGIYPFDENVIPVKKYEPEVYKRFQEFLKRKRNNPESLIKMCIEFLNKKIRISDVTLEELSTPNQRETNSDTKNEACLSQLPECNNQTLHLMEKQGTSLTDNVQIKPNDDSKLCENQIDKTPKINVISNIVIKEAHQTEYTFEALLLRKIQQDKKDSTPKKKKRVSKGAEIITASMNRKFLADKEKAKVTKTITKKREIKSNSTAGLRKRENNEPGCSGIKSKVKNEKPKQKTKKQKGYASDHSTSISDIMSEYSDSEILDDSLFETLLQEYSAAINDDICNEQLRAPKEGICEKYDCVQKISEFAAGENKMNDNTLKKNKGKGKKTKEKENLSDAVYCVKKDDIHPKRHSKVPMGEKTNVIENDVINDCKRDFSITENEKDKQIRKQSEYKNGTAEINIKEDYSMNDSVLVRYFVRKNWIYYIGFVENITEQNSKTYSIYFLKTVKKPQLRFIVPKKRDRDEVPEISIVKKIDIKKCNGNDKQYHLSNDEDSIYF